MGSDDSFQGAIRSCEFDTPHTAEIPPIPENLPFTAYFAVSEMYFFSQLSLKLGRQIMCRNMNYTNVKGETKPGKLIWIQGVPDLILKGFHPFQASDWQGASDSLRSALVLLLEEMSFLGMLPVRMRNIWKTQALVRPVIILLIPIFEHIFTKLNEPEYLPLMRCRHGSLDKNLFLLSYNFCADLKNWMRTYWLNKKVVLKVPQSASAVQVNWHNVTMSDRDFEALWDNVGCVVPEPRPSFTPTLNRNTTSSNNGFSGPDVTQSNRSQLDTATFISKSRLRLLIDQLSRKLVMPIIRRKEGGFTRYFMNEIPVCVCSATGGEVNGNDAEVIASDQMIMQLVRYGLLPEQLLTRLIQEDSRWIDPILDASRPAFQYFIDLLVSEKYNKLYDESLSRVEQCDLLNGLETHMKQWCTEMWSHRLIIYDQWTNQIPQDMKDLGFYQFYEVKKAEENGVFGKTGQEMAQSGGLPYGSQGTHFYLRPWDPLSKENWIAPHRLQSATQLTLQFATRNETTNVNKEHGESWKASAAEDSVIRAVRARASAPLRSLVDKLAMELGQSVTSTKYKEGKEIRVQVKMSEIPFPFIGGSDKADDTDVSELLAYVSLCNRLADLCIVPKELLDQVVEDKTCLDAIVQSTLPVFNFVNYIIESEMFSSLVTQLRSHSSAFSEVSEPDQTSLVSQFSAMTSKFCSDYWNGTKIELPKGHKCIGMQFKCGATVVEKAPSLDRLSKLENRHREEGQAKAEQRRKEESEEEQRELERKKEAERQKEREREKLIEEKRKKEKERELEKEREIQEREKERKRELERNRNERERQRRRREGERRRKSRSRSRNRRRSRTRSPRFSMPQSSLSDFMSQTQLSSRQIPPVGMAITPSGIPYEPLYDDDICAPMIPEMMGGMPVEHQIPMRNDNVVMNMPMASQPFLSEFEVEQLRLAELKKNHEELMMKYNRNQQELNLSEHDRMMNLRRELDNRRRILDERRRQREEIAPLPVVNMSRDEEELFRIQQKAIEDMNRESRREHMSSTSLINPESSFEQRRREREKRHAEADRQRLTRRYNDEERERRSESDRLKGFDGRGRIRDADNGSGRRSRR